MKLITLAAVLFLLPLCNAAFAQPCFTPQACRQIRERDEAQQAAISERRLAAQQAEQRRIEAQQAERRRIEAHQAALAVQQAEQRRIEAQEAENRRALAAQQVEQRRLNERLQNEAAFADVQKMPELAAYFGRPAADLIFLYNPSSRRIIRGLDGSLSAPTVRPVICGFFPTTDPSAGFLNYATVTLEKLINTRFEFRQCNTLNDADIILFTTADLSIVNLDLVRSLGDAIKAGRLAGLLEVRQDDYDAKVIADKRRQEEMAVRARQLAAEIEQGIDDDSRQGVGILRMTAGASVCLVDVDQNILLTALTVRNDGIQDWSGRAMRSYTPNQAFIAIKIGECPIVAGAAKSLRLIRNGLRRDGVDAGSGITWIDPAALDGAAATLVKERAEKARRQAAGEASVQDAAPTEHSAVSTR